MFWGYYALTAGIDQDRELQRFPTKPHHLFDEAWRMDRLEVLGSPSGRRSWPDDVKARSVMESYAPGAKLRKIYDRDGSQIAAKGL